MTDCLIAARCAHNRTHPAQCARAHASSQCTHSNQRVSLYSETSFNSHARTLRLARLFSRTCRSRDVRAPRFRAAHPHAPAKMKNRATQSACACRVARVTQSRARACVARAVHCAWRTVRRTVCSALHASVCAGLGKMSLDRSKAQSNTSNQSKQRGLRSSVRRPVRDKHAPTRRALTCAALARVSRTRFALLLARFSCFTRAHSLARPRDTLREHLQARAASH